MFPHHAALCTGKQAGFTELHLHARTSGRYPAPGPTKGTQLRALEHFHGVNHDGVEQVPAFEFRVGA